MVVLGQTWAQAYMTNHPDTWIYVRGGGPGSGLAALPNHAIDIAAASRRIQLVERTACIQSFGASPREYKIAQDGLCIYVNTDSPVVELSLSQLEQIFTGRAKNWKEFGGNDAPITLYRAEKKTSGSELFKEQILKGRAFGSGAQTMPGTAAILRAIARDVNGIGYGGPANHQGTKALKIRKTADSPAVEPTQDNVVNGKYPIRRYLYSYLSPAKDSGEIAAYLNWIRSSTGQRIATDAGFYALPVNLQEK